MSGGKVTMTMAEGAEPPIGPLKVFYSYSHRDAGLRKQLGDHLGRLRDEGVIEDWHDDKIVPGSKFNDVIRAKLDESDLILLLVSASFVASDYVNKFELPRAYELEKSGRAILLPILLRRVENWQTLPLFATWDSPLSGDTAVTERRDRETAFAYIAEGIRRTAENLRLTRSTSPGERVAAATVAAKLPGEMEMVDSPIVPPNLPGGFVCAPFETKLFDQLDRNPYQGSHDPAEPAEDSRIRAFLWLPPRHALRGDLPQFTTTAFLCDPGSGELEDSEAGVEADLERVRGYFSISPAALTPEQLEDFARVARKILPGRFLAATAIPRIILGDRVDDPDLAYETLLNLLVLPLAAGHARLRFRRFELCHNQIDDTSSKKTPLLGYSKRLLKPRFAGQFSVTQLAPSDADYVYLYVARFAQWATRRYYEGGNDDWLKRLRTSFEMTEGLP